MSAGQSLLAEFGFNSPLCYHLIGFSLPVGLTAAPILTRLQPLSNRNGFEHSLDAFALGPVSSLIRRGAIFYGT